MHRVHRVSAIYVICFRCGAHKISMNSRVYWLIVRCKNVQGVATRTAVPRQTSRDVVLYVVIHCTRLLQLLQSASLRWTLTHTHTHTMKKSPSSVPFVGFGSYRYSWYIWYLERWERILHPPTMHLGHPSFFYFSSPLSLSLFYGNQTWGSCSLSMKNWTTTLYYV